MDDKKFLTADEILAAEDVKTVEVDVPEWGGTVRLRSLSGEDAVRFVESQGNQVGSAMNIVGLCAVKDDGTPLFTLEQWELIKKKSLRAIFRLQKVALEINGLSADAAEKAKNV